MQPASTIRLTKTVRFKEELGSGNSISTEERRKKIKRKKKYLSTMNESEKAKIREFLRTRSNLAKPCRPLLRKICLDAVGVKSVGELESTFENWINTPNAKIVQGWMEEHDQNSVASRV